MNIKSLRRISALLLALTFIMALFSSVYAEAVQNPARKSIEELIAQPEAAITRGEFAMLVNTAFSLEATAEEQFLDVPADHPYASDLLCAKGLGYLAGDGMGYVKPDAVLSGAEAAVVINNFLGFDTAKVKTETDLSVPEWAKPAASVLIDFDIANKELISKKQLTVSDALSFLNALSVAAMFQGSPYALTQADLEDDFYAYTNRKYLATATIQPGYMYSMSFLDPETVVSKQEAEILQGILTAKDLKIGSDEWKINELYKMYMDNDSRTKSLSKLKQYFNEIKAVQSISELNALAKKYIKYFNLQPFYGISVNSDAKTDATKWGTLIMESGLDLGSKEYYADDKDYAPIQQAYRDYLGKLLGYIGETNNIEARINAMYEIEKTRASKALPAEAYTDPNVLYTKTTWKDMLNVVKNTQTLTYSSEIYEAVKETNVYCPNIEYIKYIESLYIEKNLAVLKDFAMLNVLASAAAMLGDDLSALADDLQKAMFGETGEKAPLEQRAQSFVTSMMSRVFSRIYSEKFGSDEVKKDVTEIVESIRDKYRERILSLTWMSETTKKKAVEKLDAVKAYVSHPDEPVKDISYEVKAKEDGGNLIDLYFTIAELNYGVSVEMLSKPVDPNLWESLPASTVNAFYSPTNNAIIVPAGILQAPFYDKNAAREENLGGIGAVIAHEFTHAFDNSGAQYDKNGTLTNWWTEEDYAAFNKMTANVGAELSKILFVGNLSVNGALCTGETIADLGAVACVLDIADDMADADLAKVMESWSSIWAARMSPEVAAFLLSRDSHAPHKVRVNFILSQMEDFYRIFNINEKNKMYTPKENRITIW